MALIPCAALMLVLYLGASVYYYRSTGLRQYDPFLQVAPARFNLAPKAEEEFRILAMGGSTTHSSIYPERIEEALQAQYPRKRFVVLNAGMPWWTTKHSLINYVTYGESLQPDLVLVMHGINDVARSCAGEDYSIGEYNDDYSHYYGSTIWTARPRTAESAFFLTFFGGAYRLAANRPVDYPVEWFSSLNAIEGNLQRIAKYVKADGVPLALLTQPSMYRKGLGEDAKVRLHFNSVFCSSPAGFWEREYPSVTAMEGAMEAANERVRRVARGENVLLVEVDRGVPKTFENFRDDVHHTDKGGLLIGNIVSEALIDAGLVDTDGQPAPAVH